MEVIDIQAVRDCLGEVSDCEDKQHAIALLEWAIGKRTFDLAEHDKQVRAEVIDECKRIIKDNICAFVGIRCYNWVIEEFNELKGKKNDNDKRKIN